MAKITRKIDKLGRVYYVGSSFNTRSKNARKAYLSQFGTRQEIPEKYSNLSTNEKKSFNAINRIRNEKGQVISKTEANALRYVFDQIGEKPTRENLKEIYKNQTLLDFLEEQEYQELFVNSLSNFKKKIIELEAKGFSFSGSSEKIINYIFDVSKINRVQYQINKKGMSAELVKVVVYLTSTDILTFDENGNPNY
jgi:CRISPR/Cas system-associated protein Cas5 (RAMP superfamily)